MNGFSDRSQVRGETNALSRALARRAPSGYLGLAESNPSAGGLGWDAGELAALLSDPRLGCYEPEPFGHPEAREAVRRELARCGFEVPVEQIMLTASTSEAYAYLFKLLCDPGDSVLVPSPSYPLFDMLAQLEGVRLLPYRLAYDGEWHLDAASLTASCEGRTRAVLTVHPNNPTGSFLKRAELSLLAELGLPIVSDEVFAEYGLGADATRAVSALELARSALVFRMGGLSKSLGLPQLKLAWTAIAGPAGQVREAQERLSHLADAYLSPATPVQLALPRLLARGEAFRARLRARIDENLRALRLQFAGASAVSVLDVEGGWYAILRLPAVLDEESWAVTLLEQDDVHVQPGFFYDLAHGVHLVLSLIVEESVFREGIRRISVRVERELAG